MGQRSPRGGSDGTQQRSSKVLPRSPDFDTDFTTAEGCIRYADFYVQRAANIAGMCMRDHLGDEHVVLDMHDIIGSLGAAQNALQLLATRHVDNQTAGVQDPRSPASSPG